MDIFIEQLYQVKPTTSTIIKKAAIMTVGVIIGLAILFVALFIMPSLASILFLAAFGAGYFAYVLCGRFNIEYEYVLTGGVIDIDRIVNCKRRKRMITFNVSDINGIGSIERMPQGREAKRFCSKNDGMFFSTASALIIFNPNEKFKAQMAKFLPRHLKKELE